MAFFGNVIVVKTKRCMSKQLRSSTKTIPPTFKSAVRYKLTYSIYISKINILFIVFVSKQFSFDEIESLGQLLSTRGPFSHFCELQLSTFCLETISGKY